MRTYNNKKWRLIPYIVDSTEVKIQRPMLDQNLFYSGKKFTYTLKYQILVDIEYGSILKVDRPFLGNESDIEIARKTLDNISNLILADKGYIGEEKFVIPFKGKKEELTEYQTYVNRKIGKVRVLIENSIGRIKKFLNPLRKI